MSPAGLDIVRRDWFKLAKEMGEAILMRILDTASNQEELGAHWVLFKELRIEVSSMGALLPRG